MLRHAPKICALALILSCTWPTSSTAITIDSVTAAAFTTLAKKLAAAHVTCPTNIAAIITASTNNNQISEATLAAGIREYSELVQTHHQKMGLASQLAIVEAVKNPSKKPVRGNIVVLDDVIRATMIACNDLLKTHNITPPPSLGALMYALNNGQNTVPYHVFIESMRDYAAVIAQHADLMQLPAQKLIVQLIQQTKSY